MPDKELMFAVGVEGDLYNPHDKQAACEFHGCREVGQLDAYEKVADGSYRLKAELFANVEVTSIQIFGKERVLTLAGPVTVRYERDTKRLYIDEAKDGSDEN